MPVPTPRLNIFHIFLWLASWTKAIPSQHFSLRHSNASAVSSEASVILFDSYPPSLPSMMESRVVRHPVPQSRCYPLEYGYEGRYSLPTARQPLQESTGNAQHGNLPASRPSYAQHLDVFNNIVRPSIHTPPIIPTQSLPSVYSSSPSPSSYHRIQQCGQFQQQQNPCRRPGINPLCLSRQFQQYRTKQAQKEDKSDQTWPDVLEDAFLDGKRFSCIACARETRRKTDCRVCVCVLQRSYSSPIWEGRSTG